MLPDRGAKIAHGGRSLDEESLLPFAHPEEAINVPSEHAGIVRGAGHQIVLAGRR